MSILSETNLYTVFQRHARATPEKTLLVVEDETIRYGEFIAETEAIARALLALGVAAGHKVGLILPNSGLWYKLYWAAVRIGAQPVPFDPQIGEWEMARLLNLSDVTVCFAATRYRQNAILENLLVARQQVPAMAHVIVVDAPDGAPSSDGAPSGDGAPVCDALPFDRFLQLSPAGAAASGDAPVCPVEETNVLMLACTSGSTGNPKVIVVPHQGFRRSQQDMADALDFGPDDVMLLGMPLYHQGGFGMGLQMVLNGGTVFYQPTFEPVKFLKLIERYKITVLQLTATLAKVILSVPDFEQYDLSSVRMAYFAGEVLPMEVARVFFEKLGIRVINIIGSTETATMVIWDSQCDADVDVNNFRPMPFTAMKILDEAHQDVASGDVGTLFIHTDALLMEYYKNEAETARRLHWWDGLKWFDTGDLGQRCPDGRVRFVGRVKRAIKRGSNLIYPEEIESFLLTHPDIEAVAVTGQSHDLIGEMVVAHIQPRQGRSFTRRDLIEFCRGRLAAYKIPDQIVVVEAIPKDIGKVQFKYLRD
ncbi:MAG: acyl--CoA ligase [Anaerolineae bacterium]|nr:acyl--CoA ligase [Anaerolineae bacterium]